MPQSHRLRRWTSRPAQKQATPQGPPRCRIGGTAPIHPQRSRPSRRRHRGRQRRGRDFRFGSLKGESNRRCSARTRALWCSRHCENSQWQQAFGQCLHTSPCWRWPSPSTHRRQSQRKWGRPLVPHPPCPAAGTRCLGRPKMVHFRFLRSGKNGPLRRRWSPKGCWERRANLAPHLGRRQGEKRQESGANSGPGPRRVPLEKKGPRTQHCRGPNHLLPAQFQALLGRLHHL